MAEQVRCNIDDVPQKIVTTLAAMYHNADEARSMIKTLESGRRLDTDNLLHIERLAHNVETTAYNLRKAAYRIYDATDIEEQ